jgi:RNA polymerase sigma-70 factor (ECF subfamily)
MAMDPVSITTHATSADATRARERAAVRAALRRVPGARLDRAYRLAGLILGEAAEAEDAVQDALLRAWRSADGVRDVAQVDAWFDRILVNTCRDRLRRRRILRFVSLDDAPEPAVERDPFRAVLEGDALLHGLRRVSPDERIVVVLHYWADLRLEDVADRLGWPVGTVKSRLHRALRTLRRELDPDREGHR